MSTLTLQLPDSIYQRIREMANQEEISVDQFVALAVTEKLSAFRTKEYLEERARRASKEKLEKALSKIPDVEPEDYDKL